MDRASADEVAAETFVIAWRRREDRTGEPLSWLLGIARGVLANRRRGDARRAALGQRLAEGWVGVTPDHADAVGERSEMLSALAGLGEADREVLVLLSWDGLNRGQAARVLGCSRGALAVRLLRARRRLEAALVGEAESDSSNAVSRGRPS